MYIADAVPRGRLAAAVPDAAMQAVSFPAVGECLGIPAEQGVQTSEVVECSGFAGLVPGRPEEVERVLVLAECLTVAALPFVLSGQVDMGRCCADLISDLGEEHQRGPEMRRAVVV